MKIGIMSDSHDNLSMIQSAVSVFNEAGVEFVLHAGDIISPFTSAVFKGLKAKMVCVFGNNDGDREFLKKSFQGVAEFHGDFADLTLNDKRIIMLHGTTPQIISALLNINIYDVIIRGHDHKKTILKRDETILLNPGETCGYLTGTATIMILDLDTMQPEIIELENYV